jgi:hypothetical protein
MSRVLNHTVYVAAAISNIICGCAVFDFGHRYAHAFHIMSGRRDAMGHVVYNDNFPLPCGTLLVLPYVRSNAPIVVGFLIGLTSLALLLFLERGDENRKAWIPACVAAAFLLGFLPLIYIAWAMSLPFSYG